MDTDQKKELSDQLKYNEVRAKIWELAADKSLSEDQLLQRLFDAIGLVVDANRIYYGKFVEDARKPTGNERILVVEDEELSSSGIKIRYTKPVSNKEFGKGVREILDQKRF